MKNSKKITLPITVAALIVAVVALLLWHPWAKKKADQSSKETVVSADFSSLVGQNFGGFLIVNAQNKGGIFVEDKSNAKIDSVLTLEIQNMANKTLQYTELRLTCGGEIYDFSFSTVPSDAKVLVQEKNKKCCKKTGGDWTGTLTNTVWFNKDPSMNERLFKVMGDEEKLQITNLTTADVNGLIRIAYKNWDGERYVGGITYSVTLPTGLQAGKSKNFMVPNFHLEKSRLMFVDYVS